jgi:hypothetical protein
MAPRSVQTAQKSDPVEAHVSGETVTDLIRRPDYFRKAARIANLFPQKTFRKANSVSSVKESTMSPLLLIS